MRPSYQREAFGGGLLPSALALAEAEKAKEGPGSFAGFSAILLSFRQKRKSNFFFFFLFRCLSPFFLQMVFFLACSFFVLEAIGRKVLHPRSVFLVSSVLSRFRSDGARFRFTLSSESDRYKDIWCWHLEIFEPCRKFLRYLLR